MTIRAVIVDDEAPARLELRFLLGAHAGVQVVGEASTAEQALAALDRGAVDVLFLDVELRERLGTDLARLLRESAAPPAIVFVTAHAEYAAEAFAVEAFDYLLKPVEPERLARVVERLGERAVAPPSVPEKIAVVAAGRTELLDAAQVHYVHADGDYSRVHTYDRSYLSTASLGELERKLGPGFARIHRSYIVNLAKVSAIRRATPDRFRLRLGDAARTELDVSRRQSRLVRERLGL